MRRRNLLQPKEVPGRAQGADQTRKAAFAEPPTGANQVCQLDFTEFETITGGLWRIAGCADSYSKYEFGWHLATTCNALDPITAVQVALTEAERLGARSLAEQLANPVTGKIYRIKLVTDNGGAFTSSRFAVPIASRPELLHIHTRRKTLARTVSESERSAR